MRTIPGSTAVCLVAFVLSVSQLASAQALPQSSPSPDWSSFQNPPPAAPPNSLPAPPPLPPEGAPPVVTSTPPSGLTPTPAPSVAATPAETAPVIVSERIVPGPVATPATAGMSFGDPRSARLTSANQGPVGVYNVISAEAGEPLVLRFALYGAYFNKSDFPVLRANTEYEIGTLTLGFSPLRWLDLYVGTEASAVNSTGTSGTNPSFISELGDFWGGVKIGGYVAKPLALAIDLRGEAYSGVGTTGIGAAAFMPTGVFTLDFLKVSKAPIRFHLNIGGQFGNLNALAPKNAAGQTLALTAPEQFALGWTKYNQLRGGAALELPFPVITPFVEYTIVYPISAQNLLGPDQVPVSVASSLPQQIDFGFRVTALRDLSFLVGGSATMQQSVAIGVPILPYWLLFGGLTYNVDLAPHGPTRIIETRSTGEAPMANALQGNVHGTVTETETKVPIPNAIVQSSIPDQGPVATNALGQYQGYPSAAGPVDLTVSKEGYKATIAHALIQAGQIAVADVALERELKVATLRVVVHGARGRPLAATVTVIGPQAFQKELAIPESGTGELALPSAGRYELKVTSKGHLAQEHHTDVALGQTNSVEFTLLPEPKKSALIVSGKTIKLKKQIHFQANSAKILPDSAAILAEIASYIVTHDVGKLRVEGFTDNIGGKARNLKLSQSRADAVMQHLIDDGIPAEKLEAVGYGDQKPVAPNLTARGRALNRRVEFVILQ
jgi:OOP family OmpA-OmpF porin